MKLQIARSARRCAYTVRTTVFANFSVLVILVAAAAGSAHGFQISPLSSEWEEKLTNEPTSSRARIAGKLGRLIKGPVHEEVAQLAMGCTTPDKDLPTNAECASADAGFATQFINYGVRWNDLPPFQLRPNEGSKCSRIFGVGKACNVAQTIRFSTQPDCWYCMFEAAGKIAASGRKIVGCLPRVRPKGSRMITSHLLARSHYGDLQFFHAMAQEDDLDPAQTRADILGWLEFAWKVATREIPRDALLRDVNISAMKERFHCSGWSVADLYVLGRQDTMLRFVHDIAFGSVLHTIQDSFAEGHVEREPAGSQEQCSTTLAVPRPGRIREFHSYAGQDGKLHDVKDHREAMAGAVGGPVSGAVEASRQLAAYYGDRRKWAEVEPYMQCVLDLSSEARRSSAGGEFRRR